MKIDRNSYGTIATVWLIAISIAFLTIWICNMKWLMLIVVGLCFFACGFITYFFRIPRRQQFGSGSLVTSVADGKVVICEKTFEKEYLQRDCILVSVYMDFFDVHANFWPVTGEVTYYKYHPGRYLLAFLPKSSELNEHASTCIKTASGQEVFFKQIAGTFARRIVSYSKPGLPTEAGRQCGVIKFGSRIDMYLPLDADIQVEVGDYTRACETIIATLK
ncbi:MAG: phosphatidylserine decarboxylase [Bacteroidales bacterium]|nr:phosphatidylserine decarboxylase [Bacteroidales bacterium]